MFKNLHWLLAIATLFSTLSSFAFSGEAAFDKEKIITESFAISTSAYVEIDNKYGDVEIETWTEDSVKFIISVTAYADESYELDEMLNLININFRDSRDFVLVETDWSEDVGVLKQQLLRVNQELTKDVRVEVNYKVMIPSNIDLEIKNKFGNIYMGDYAGSLEVDLSYGDFRARNLGDLKRLKVKSGKVRIKSIDKGKLDLSSVKSCDVGNGENLVLKSSSSQIDFEELGTINITSKHDDISIEEVDELSGEFMLTDVFVETIHGKMNATTKYGSMKVINIEPTSKLIFLDGTKTDFLVGFSPFYKGKADVKISDQNLFDNDASFESESTSVDSEGWYSQSGIINAAGTSQVTIISDKGFLQFK